MDRTTIALNGEFTAADLESIIRTLAEARAGMSPPVPMSPPDTASEMEVLVQESAVFKLRTLAGGGLRFWIRNEGIGWIALTLSQDDAQGLRAFLSEKLGHTHTTQ